MAGGGGVWLLGSRPGWVLALVGVCAGVGLLFEIWIVDASIKIFVVVSSVHHQPGVPAAFRGGGWVGLVVCVTSCEGHMVDALASRADEGRRSLR